MLQLRPMQTASLLRTLRLHIPNGTPVLQRSIGLPQQRTLFWSRGGGGDSSSKGSGSTSGGSDSESMEDVKKQGSVSSSSSSDAPSQENAIVPVGSTHSAKLQKQRDFSLEPRIILPLSRRPLFPGQQQVLQVTHPAVVESVMKLMEKGTPPFIGAFLHRQESTSFTMSEGPESQLQGDNSSTPSQREDLSQAADPREELHRVGTRARVMQVAPVASKTEQQPNGLQLLLSGHDLVTIEKVLDLGPPLRGQLSRLKLNTEEEGDALKAYINETMHTIREIMAINPQFREHASMIHQGLERLDRGDPNAIAHFAASLTTASGPALMEVLEEDLPSKKLDLALTLLKKELELSQLQAKIATKINETMSSHQREFWLREQMKTIKKELGEDKSDGTDKLLEKFRQRLEGKTVPKDAKEAIDNEMEKFAGLAKESQEYQTTRNYLDWLTVLPWGVHSTDVMNLQKAREILDRDHYGLQDVKERITELIAVGKLCGAVQGKILCVVGPPGVGKTSIGRSIAEALGREFYRFSVGGLYDVAEIKGHRRTYVGAMPGKMIQCLKKVQTSNPLVLIDEVDKIGRGQGDPASALLELLDPSQNDSFLDHYLDVAVDFSRVLFVCTANVTDTIPGPLLDRMEVIRLSGYDFQEKVRIAEDFLVPSSMREVSLWPPMETSSRVAGGEEIVSNPTDAEPAVQAEEVLKTTNVEKEPSTAAELEEAKVAKAYYTDAAVDKSALESLIRWYCREAGVRNLQKHVEKICRKLATRVVEQDETNQSRETSKNQDPARNGTSSGAVKGDQAIHKVENGSVDLRVTEDNLSEFVGKPLFTSDRLYEQQLPAGTVTGLAWTAMGGSVLYVEAMALPRPTGNKGSAASPSVTGQLGNVMKESSQIAHLVARRALTQVLPESAFFEEHDLYVHCPEGATPKDGPSAGVTMTTALLSLALERPLDVNLAMSGEISLNGKVLPVGGIKEKTIAARRAGCNTLIFPQANRKDVDELPEYIREGLQVHFASDYSDVLRIAFPEPAQQERVDSPPTA